MAITGAIVAGATLFTGEQVAGNQQRQKAKGQASAVERDAATAQATADAKLAQQHISAIDAQSTAAQIARDKMSKPIARPSTILTSGQGAPQVSAQPKSLLGT